MSDTIEGAVPDLNGATTLLPLSSAVGVTIASAVASKEEEQALFLPARKKKKQASDRDRSLDSMAAARSLFAVILVGVLLWALAAVISASGRDARKQLQERFETRSQHTARFISAYLQDTLAREQSLAEKTLVAETPTRAQFEEAVAAFSRGPVTASALPAVLLDATGSVLAVNPDKPELIGSELASRYEHLATALAGTPAVSNVVPSAARRAPIVAMATPFDTPFGRRVFSVGYDLSESELAPFLATTSPIRGQELYLLDAKGTAIASEPAAARDAPRTRVLHAAGAGSTSAEDGGHRYLVSATSVKKTPWRLVAAVPESSLYRPLKSDLWVPWLVFGALSLASLIGLGLLRHLHRSRRELLAANIALELSSSRLNDAQETANIGSWAWDLATDIVSWSDHLYRIYGLDQSRPATLEDFQSRVHPEDRHLVEFTLAGAIDSGQPFELDHRIVLANGEVRFQHACGEVVRDAAGNVVAMHGTSQDVTEAREAEGETQRLAAQLQLLLQSAAEGIYGIDVEGRFTFVNRAAAEMLGRDASQIIGRNAHTLLHHSYADGTPYPVEQCPIFRTFTSRQGCTIDDEVLWRADGTSFAACYSSFPLERDGQVEGAVITFSDISERRRAEAALQDANACLQKAATTDPLTGLANRALFSDRVDQALALAARERREVCVLFIDLDRFKDVNDSFGHHCGDELLIEVARRLLSTLRDSDTVVRLGGDEFAVLLPGTNPGEAALAAERVLQCFRPSFVSSGVEFFMTASAGVAVWPEDCNSKVELLQHADLAMYRAKAAGGDRFEMFQPAMTVAARERLQMERDLRRAIDEQQFFLRFHPQVHLATGEVSGVEALVRWSHPVRGEVGPLDFIPLAEETGLIVQLGAWVLAEACRHVASWRTDLGLNRPLRLAVNVSPRQLIDPGFAQLVADRLAESGMRPTELELEITESTLITESDPAVTTLRRLRSLGVSLAIDDFGTGYSSLAYLRRFRVDRLKIDRSFIAELHAGDTPPGPGDGALIAAAISLAHALGLEAVAEGVETDEQRDLLLSLGCDQGQGYLWTVPLLSDDLRQWLKRVQLALASPPLS